MWASLESFVGKRLVPVNTQPRVAGLPGGLHRHVAHRHQPARVEPRSQLRHEDQGDRVGDRSCADDAGEAFAVLPDLLYSDDGGEADHRRDVHNTKRDHEHHERPAAAEAEPAVAEAGPDVSPRSGES